MEDEGLHVSCIFQMIGLKHGNKEKKINFVKATFYAGVSQDPVFGFKDIRSEKAPSNKLQCLQKI